MRLALFKSVFLQTLYNHCSSAVNALFIHMKIRIKCLLIGENTLLRANGKWKSLFVKKSSNLFHLLSPNIKCGLSIGCRYDNNFASFLELFQPADNISSHGYIELFLRWCWLCYRDTWHVPMVYLITKLVKI